MLLYIYVNDGVPSFCEKARIAASFLTKNGFSLCCAEKDLRFFDKDTVEKHTERLKCDYVTAVGGDGTMLRAAHRAISLSIPFFGINAGRVGFLSTFDFTELAAVTPDTLFGLNRTVRSLLEVRVNGGEPKTAINDVVLSKSNPSKTVELSVRYGEHDIAVWKADGVIVATATGSTAYSLSAGGPILSPELAAAVVTPICPTNGFNRSLVLNMNSGIAFSPTSRNENGVIISIDGENCGVCEEGLIEIRQSDRSLHMLTTQKHNFYTAYYSHNLERNRYDEVKAPSADS